MSSTTSTTPAVATSIAAVIEAQVSGRLSSWQREEYVAPVVTALVEREQAIAAAIIEQVTENFSVDAAEVRGRLVALGVEVAPEPEPEPEVSNEREEQLRALLTEGRALFSRIEAFLG